MKDCVGKKQCQNCSHRIENKYHYYTHDNRMVECHLYTCGRQKIKPEPKPEEVYLDQEKKGRF